MTHSHTANYAPTTGDQIAHMRAGHGQWDTDFTGLAGGQIELMHRTFHPSVWHTGKSFMVIGKNRMGGNPVTVMTMDLPTQLNAVNLTIGGDLALQDVGGGTTHLLLQLSDEEADVLARWLLSRHPPVRRPIE